MILRAERHKMLSAIVFMCVTLSGVGCRDTDPPPTYYGDLGTDGTLLLPVPSPQYAISKVDDAQADWHPVAKPGERVEEEAEEEDVDESEDETSTTETEAEIRELIEAYNELAAERSMDDLLEYYVPEQQETLRPLLETSFNIAEKVAELADALTAKLPDAEERIRAALAGAGGSPSGVLVVESLNVVSDTEVTGPLAAGGLAPTCRFVVSDEEWFIEMPQADAAKTKSELDAVLARFSGWVESLSSGGVSAEELLVQIEAASAEAPADAEGAPAAEDTEGGPSETD